MELHKLSARTRLYSIGRCAAMCVPMYPVPPVISIVGAFAVSICVYDFISGFIVMMRLPLSGLVECVLVLRTTKSHNVARFMRG